MTLIQRFLAFLTDSAIVLLVMAVLLAMVWHNIIVWSDSRDLVLCAATLAYFALFEGFRGQTPGKRLWRVRVADVAGHPPGVYRALLRAGVFFLPPLTFGFVFGVLRLLVYMPDAVANTLAGGLSYATLLVWPVSIIAGRGAEGIHDRLAGCHVERFRHPTLWRAVQPRVLVIGGLTSLILGFAGEGLMASLSKRYPNVEFSDRAWQEFRQLLPPPVWYDERIANASDYLNLGRESVFLMQSKPTFSQSWAPNIPEPMRDGTYQSGTFVGYEIDVRPIALNTSLLQAILTNALVSRTTAALGDQARDGFVVECRFVSRARVGLLNVDVARRMTGGWVKFPNGTGFEFLMEPDDRFSFRIYTEPAWRVSQQVNDLRSFAR